jgi:hypothetical protein
MERTCGANEIDADLEAGAFLSIPTVDGRPAQYMMPAVRGSAALSFAVPTLTVCCVTAEFQNMNLNVPNFRV